MWDFLIGGSLEIGGGLLVFALLCLILGLFWKVVILICSVPMSLAEAVITKLISRADERRLRREKIQQELQEQRVREQELREQRSVGKSFLRHKKKVAQQELQTQRRLRRHPATINPSALH